MTECVLATPIGNIRLSEEGGALVSAKLCNDGISSPTSPVLLEATVALKEYFSGNGLSFSFPLAPKGTEFQRACFCELAKIPFGEVVSYGAIAKAVAKRRGLKAMSAQAVGRAIGANPILIFLPCHRVVGADLRLVGFREGLSVKEKLLVLEGHRIEGERLKGTKLFSVE